MSRQRSTMTVTLYDLVAQVNDALGADNDRLVARIVTEVLRRNGARFGTPATGRVAADVPLLPWTRQVEA